LLASTRILSVAILAGIGIAISRVSLRYRSRARLVTLLHAIFVVLLSNGSNRKKENNQQEREGQTDGTSELWLQGPRTSFLCGYFKKYVAGLSSCQPKTLVLGHFREFTNGNYCTSTAIHFSPIAFPMFKIRSLFAPRLQYLNSGLLPCFPRPNRVISFAGSSDALC